MQKMSNPENTASTDSYAIDFSEQDEYTPLRDIVFKRLRHEILKGELLPGKRLMEVSLAERLGVSRTPVREAIRQLELDGLVIVMPRRGAMVAGITEKSLKDVIEVRRSLEMLAIELACERMTDEDLKDLKEAQLQFTKAVESEDMMEIAQADERYHDCIYKGTYNIKLIQLLNNLREQIYRYRFEYIKDTGKRQVLLIEHQKILKAVEARSLEEARRAMREHIDNQEITVSKNIKDA